MSEKRKRLQRLREKEAHLEEQLRVYTFPERKMVWLPRHSGH